MTARWSVTVRLATGQTVARVVVARSGALAIAAALAAGSVAFGSPKHELVQGVDVYAVDGDDIVAGGGA